MEIKKLNNIIEAALMAADRPITVNELENLFGEDDADKPNKDDIRKSLKTLIEQYEDRGIRLKQVGSGFRIYVPEDYANWVSKLWEEKPPRYSRAFLETLVIIAYRQPATRAEIEDIRGVSVSTKITKTLQERGWIRVVGHRDVPGKPAMFGTTKEFLDYFNLKSLDELPSLAELKDIDSLHPELDLHGDKAIPANATELESEVDNEDQDTEALEAKLEGAEPTEDSTEAESTANSEPDTKEALPEA